MLQTNAMKKNLAEKRILEKEAKAKLSERAARAEKAAAVWNNHPLFKGELSNIKEAKNRQNAAINLTNQARFMKQLNEQETSSEFQRMAPANMMRLVQLTMTNLNRGNVFSEYAMETARDAIYYIKPYFSKSVAADAGNFGERSMSYKATENTADPFGFNTADEATGVGGYNGNNPAYGGQKRARNNAINTNARKAIYESSESRFANELANTSDVNIAANIVTIKWKGGPFGTNGENYVPGYSKIYVGTDERDVIAIQDPNTLEYLVSQEFAGATVSETPRAASGGEVTVTVDLSNCVDESKKTQTEVNAYGRFESEADYDGTHLGEVNLYMSVYELRPHRTSIGVSWTKLAEITLDSTFNTQVDDLLLASAADTIHGQLDLQAFKDAYALAKTNPSFYKVEFDAGYSTDTDGKSGTKDSYVDTANTFGSAIDIASAALYSDIKRGAVNKLVVGVSVASYIKLMAGFTPKGVQNPTGVYKIGELDGIEVYKAPIEVIPDNEVLCVFKNPNVDNDVALVYGTLVPFVSNKLEYPTFYSRAGLASFGDVAQLNPKYLSRIIVNNLKDRIDTKAYQATAGF